MFRYVAILLAVAALPLAGVARADLVVEEPLGEGYTYEAGLVGQNPPVLGFQDAWQLVSSGIYRAASSGLGYANDSQLLASSGGSIQIITPNTSDRRINRAMDYTATDTAGTFYVSGVLGPPQPRSDGLGFAMMQLLDTDGGVNFGLKFGVKAGTVRLRARSTGAVPDTDYIVANSYTPGENLFFVIKAEQNVSSWQDRISVWVNPADLGSEALAGPADGVFMTGSLDQTNGNRNIDTFLLRTMNLDSNSTAAFDEVRMGQTWQDVTPHEDVVKIRAANDAHVARHAPDSVLWDDQVMEVKNAAGDFHRKAYVRFDLSNVNQEEIAGAALSLTMTHDGGTLDNNQTNAWVFNVFGLDDGDAGENWQDWGGVTWNNAPQNDTGSGDQMLGGATLLGQFTVAGSPTVQLMLTGEDLPGLAEFLRASQDETATLIITRQTQGDGVDINLNTIHGIRSLNYDIAHGTDSAPTLFVTVPEPVTLAMAAAGCAALVGYVRRRRRCRCRKA